MNLAKQQEKLARFLTELRKHTTFPTGTPIRIVHKATEAPQAEVLAEDWRTWPEAPRDLVFGGTRRHHWFVAEVEMSAAPVGCELVLQVNVQNDVLVGRTQGQGLAWLDGVMLQGVDGYHAEIVLGDRLAAGSTGVLHINHCTADDRQLCGFELVGIWRDKAATALYYDLSVPFEVARRLPDTDLRKYRIFNLIDQALLALDFRDRVKFAASLPAASAFADAIFALSDTEDKPTASCVGHTHIDVAWLWPISQTREKMMRSMATALKLLDENPDFVFMYNQCVLLDYLEEDAPELFERIRAHAKSGRFEIEGAMWLEPDVNIISGESMVRQIQRGKRYHQDRFGVDPKVLWLPDTFGYSAALPQIMRKSGIEFLVTSKLSWNDTNRMPYDTFFWHGIDGSEVKTYLITTQRDDAPTIRTNYGPSLDVSFVQGAWKRYEPKGLNDNYLIPFGHGDGGGGVNQEMIEIARRMERGIPGSPKLRMEGIVPFLDRLGRRMDEGDVQFPKWVGELYLEYHRGTLTSVARNKRNNRLAENRMKDLEFAQSMLLHATADAGDPSEQFAEFWRIVLLNQFHDILPGTSIREVYEDSDIDYGRLFTESDALLRTLAAGLTDAPLAVLNPTGMARGGEPIFLPAEFSEAANAVIAGTEVIPVQQIKRADGTRTAIVPAPALPPTSVLGLAGVTSTVEDRETKSGLLVTERTLENARLKVTFDDNGEIVSLFDRRLEREIVRPGGAANKLVAYEDKPIAWDAWDIDWYFDQKPWPVEAPSRFEIVEHGPYRAALRIERRYNNSHIVQIVSLMHDAHTVEFDTFVDWQESQTVLKTGFDIDLPAVNLHSEIQFGHVTRPTHANTSWDWARFEASMHRWIALSEAELAVGLINDSKYGYDARDGRPQLTLIKSGIHPFPEADREHHRIRYGITIAHGSEALARVARRAEAFSHPLQAISTNKVTSGAATGPAKQAGEGLFRFDAANIAVHAILPGEHADEIIIRLVEEGSRPTQLDLTFVAPILKARRIDLMNRHDGDLPVGDERHLTLSFKPFEIQSLAITVKRDDK